MNVTLTINMDAKSEHTKIELYLLIIIIKLTIFSVFKFANLTINAHKKYKKNLKKQYEQNHRSENKLTKVVVQRESDRQIPAQIILNPSDLHSSATAHNHTDLKR